MSQVPSSSESEKIPGPTCFTTRQTPAWKQFEAWREFNSAIVEISLLDDDARGFVADHLSWNIGGIVFTQARLPAATERRWRHLRQSSIDHWCLVLARSTRPEGAGAGRPSDVASHLSFRSLTEPFEGRGADGEVLTLFLPRTLFQKEARAFDNASGAIPCVGLGGILADFMTILPQRLPTISRQDLPGLEAAICALVKACVAPSADRLAGAERPMNAILLGRARRVVRQNLASPEFGPDALCRALSVSRSRLYRVFESRGGVSHFIQQERLDAAQRRLGDCRSSTPINALAIELGFTDHSTFTRAFKRRFGCSPSEAREMALAEASLGPRDPYGLGPGDDGQVVAALEGTIPSPDETGAGRPSRALQLGASTDRPPGLF